MQKEEAIKLSGRKLVSVAIQGEEDKARFNAILEAEHYLGARQPSGNTIFQAILDEAGGWVAVALWCGASYRIGGDYMLQVKGNQPMAQAFCENAFDGLRCRRRQ